MKKYSKPCLVVERFELTQHLASCGSLKINQWDITCVLSAPDAPSEMRDLAMIGYFMAQGGCPKLATDGALCVNASTNMAFTS